MTLNSNCSSGSCKPGFRAAVFQALNRASTRQSTATSRTMFQHRQTNDITAKTIATGSNVTFITRQLKIFSTTLPCICFPLYSSAEILTFCPELKKINATLSNLSKSDATNEQHKILRKQMTHGSNKDFIAQV